MRFKTLLRNSDTENSYNPYPKWVKDKANVVPVPDELIVRNTPLIGNSVATAEPGEQIDAHHIFPMALFPNEHTQTIKVPQERHKKLHEILAKGYFYRYEKELIKENPQVPPKIAKILYERIEEL